MLNRRHFLAGSAGLLTSAFLPVRSQLLKAAPNVETELGKIKISDVKTATINLGRYDMNLVKVTTDAGIYGIGEAYKGSGIVEHIQAIKGQIIDQDPLQVEFLVAKMMERGVGWGSRMGSLSGAIAGIETALWDLAGKILNVPVYVLLGGKFRDKLLIYYDTGAPNTIEPGPWVEEAQRTLDYGFKAVKFDLNRFQGENWNRTLTLQDMRRWLKILEAIRKTIGPDFPLGVDFHWRFNSVEILNFIQMTEPLNLWFIEDPIPPYNADALARLTGESNVPIATGENLFTRQSFRPFIEKQACDYIQPDFQKCGGLLEAKRIADWANLYYIGAFCHNMCSPVGTVASGHACLAIQSFVSLESDNVELQDWENIIEWDGPLYKNGYLEIPNKPGLGIQLNEGICRKHLVQNQEFF